MAGRFAARVVASRAFGPGSRGLRTVTTLVVLLSGTAALGGCGSSAHPTQRAAVTSAYPRPPKISAKLHAEELAIHRQVLASLHAPAPKTVRPGHIPSYIPRSTLKIGRIVTATPQHPQLAIQGNSLRVKLPHASVVATVTGPYIPIKYSGTNDPIVPGSFMLTFSDARGRIPLDASDFHITNALGTSLFPTIDVQGGGEIPTTIPTGRKLTLIFHDAKMPIGQGYFEYNPLGILVAKGQRPMANWDLDIESD
jgi:hypothetical protein